MNVSHLYRVIENIHCW